MSKPNEMVTEFENDAIKTILRGTGRTLDVFVGRKWFGYRYIRYEDDGSVTGRMPNQYGSYYGKREEIPHYSANDALVHDLIRDWLNDGTASVVADSFGWRCTLGTDSKVLTLGKTKSEAICRAIVAFELIWEPKNMHRVQRVEMTASAQGFELCLNWAYGDQLCIAESGQIVEKALGSEAVSRYMV